MRITLLHGIHAVRDDGTPVKLQPRMRAVLLVLLVEGVNAPVSADRLLELVWGEQADDKHTLHNTMSKLRARFGRDRIVRDPDVDGYRFVAGPGTHVDLWAWWRLLDVCTEMSRSDPYAAAFLWDRALGLWSPNSLTGLPGTIAMDALCHGLRRERLKAVEQKSEVRLSLGRHAQVAAELPALVDRHPEREHLRELLMVALYRESRPAEARELYRRLSERLRDDGGAQPLHALQSLHERIHANDPALLDVVPPALPAADLAVMRSGADVSMLSTARMWSALVDEGPDGPDSYTTAADRAAARFVQAITGAELGRRQLENLQYGDRFVRRAAVDHGIGRFLELGAPVPSARFSLHRGARLARQGTRFVYANPSGPLADHARERLHGVEGVDFVQGGLDDPERLLAQPSVRALFQLDLPPDEREPVAIIDRHNLNVTPDSLDPRSLYAALLDGLAPGSMLAVTAAAADCLSTQVARYIEEVQRDAPEDEHLVLRGRERLAEIVPPGMEVLPPGVVDAFDLWAGPRPAGRPGGFSQFVVAAIKR
ncbi:BTAD domain-containing putative transcriptional regulator [Spirillospora sp. CA-294931]|uniref:BTAD domain-containing putative transcriptional regulator n=1 Tax=Spirillospora sp. CA-294931 TaxID=3240042 RepID=UPI003D91359D